MSDKEKKTPGSSLNSNKDGIGEEKSKNLSREGINEISSNPTLKSQPSPQIPTESQQPAIRDFCVERLLGGSTYVELEAELKGYNIQISKSQLNRLFPKKYIDSVREQLKAQEQEQKTFLQTPQTVLPSAHVVVPLSWLDSYAKTLPKAQKVTHEQMKANILRYNELLNDQAKRQQSRPSSNPSTYGSGYDQLCRELAESEKVERIIRLRRGLGGHSGNNGVEQILKAIQIGVQLVPKGQNVDAIGVYRSGRLDQKTEGPSGTTNALDLRLEEMRQSHDLDMQRLSWEQKRYFLKMENDTTKWNKIEETFGPILKMASPDIRDAIRKIGEQVGKSIGGLGANPNPNAQTEVSSVECPKCKSPLNVRIPEGLEQIQVKCPKCQNLFKIGKDQPEGSSEIRPKVRLGYKES